DRRLMLLLPLLAAPLTRDSPTEKEAGAERAGEEQCECPVERIETRSHELTTCRLAVTDWSLTREQLVTSIVLVVSAQMRAPPLAVAPLRAASGSASTLHGPHGSECGVVALPAAVAAP